MAFVHASLTLFLVRETLEYAASFRLGSATDAETRAQLVQRTIEELSLIDAAESLIGGSGLFGISGGEKRRLAIGCILVGSPSVLVLDEVTTGLGEIVLRVLPSMRA